LKTVALDGVLCAGFALAAAGLRRGRAYARPAGFVLAGAALWRAVDIALDAVSAVAAGDFGYWRGGQLITAGLLVLAGVLAAVAVGVMARRPA
ncbi:MAG: hypothetical protein ACRD0P_04030, partial [Stackebrandtia sp.]